jgi:hypothetical protein
MHARTGILAVVASACMPLALVLAWCLAGVEPYASGMMQHVDVAR